MSDSHGPLHGVTVIEMAAIGPCPFAGILLADMGATVRIDAGYLGWRVWAATHFPTWQQARP